VHDFGVTAANVGFLVMELLEGTTLRAEIDAHGRLAPPRAMALMRGVASAVDAAHQQQLIHRDLKPENIFLVGRGAGEIAKVLDFGIAKSLAPVEAAASAARETHLGVLIGTPLYMAPEQLRGEPADTSWDLWALSIVLFEMLTGAHPFAGTSGHTAPSSPAGYEALLASHLAGLPPSCAPFFVRALAMDVERRPPSASRFIAELEGALGPARGPVN
jgi:serine/threonine-protein kinase